MCHINRHMVLSKVAYFFVFIPNGLMILFNVVFLISLGLSTQQSGLINGLRTVPRIFGAPLWGWIADRTQKHRAIMMVLCIGSMIFTLPQPWAASYIKYNMRTTSFNESGMGPALQTRFPSSQNHTKFLDTNPVGKLKRNDSKLLFGVMLTTNMLSSFFEGPIIGFLATITMQKVSKSPVKDSFGRQRAFGSIGFGFSAVTAGFIADFLTIPNVSPFTPVLIFYTLGMLCFMVTSYFYFQNASELLSAAINDPKGGANTAWRSLMHTLKKKDVLFFLVVVFLSGISAGVYDGYLLVHLKDLKASKTVMGFSRTAANMASTVFFFFSKKVIKLLGGEWKAMAVSAGVYSLRFLCFAIMDKPIYVIPIQFTMNCFAYSMSWTAIIQHTNIVSDTETKTTLYGIINSLHFGFGTLAANIVGGILYQNYGSVSLFQGCSVMCVSLMIAIIVFIILISLTNKEDNVDGTEMLEITDDSGLHNEEL